MAAATAKAINAPSVPPKYSPARTRMRVSPVRRMAVLKMFMEFAPNVPLSHLASVVSGQWSVVSGQWSVVSGQWSVVSGKDCRLIGLSIALRELRALSENVDPAHPARKADL